jgi:O-antigen ligase
MNIDINVKFLSFSRRIAIGKQWIQFGIIVLVAFVSVVASYWGSTRILLLLLLLLAGSITILVLLKWPNVGFVLVFLGGAFVPIVGPSGVNAAEGMVALMLGLWLLSILTRRSIMQPVNSRVVLPVVVFLGISVLAFAMGQIPWFVFANQAPLTAQAGGFAIFVLSAGALLMAANIVREERWLQRIVWVFIGMGALYVAGRTVELGLIDRLYHPGFSAGSMFWTWLVALALSQAVFNSQLKQRFRLLLILIVLVTFYAAIVQAYDWKSGWLPPLIAAAVILGIRFKRLSLFAIPAGLIFAGAIAKDLISSDAYSWGTRLDAWVIVLKIAQVNPLLGLGFSNYYWYTPLFAIRGYAVVFNSHSQYVDLIAEVGILGLLCFLWIFFELGRLSWRLSRELPDGFARAYANGVLAGVVGTLVAGYLVDWVLPFVYNIGLTGFRASIVAWIFCGALVGVEQIYLGESKRQVSASIS